MTSDAPIRGYRFSDLKQSRIVSSRSDLHEKQQTLGFPKPVKTGARSAWWPAEEIHAWVQTRIALRDNPDNSNDDGPAPAASVKPSATPKPAQARSDKAVAPKALAARKPPARAAPRQARRQSRVSV